MIDFKHFVTTIASIFIALAVGVALGAGPLKGTADEQLRVNVERLSKDKANLQGELLAEQSQSKYRDAFTSATARDLVRGKLANRKVLLVTLPGASGEVASSIRTMVGNAGGAVTGTVDVQAKFADPAQTQLVDDVTSKTAAAVDIRELEVPPRLTGYQRAGYVLARALVAKNSGAAQDPTAQTILTAFTDAGLVKAPGRLDRANLAIVVAGPAPTAAETPATDPDALVGLVYGIDVSDDGTVVAGPPESAANGGAVAVVRSDSLVKSIVSTVDEAALPAGVITTVLALADQIDGRTGHYGNVGNVDGVVPPTSGTP